MHRGLNGKVVGTLVGAGIGLASRLALASLLQNEGGNGTLPAIGLTALGAVVERRFRLDSRPDSRRRVVRHALAFCRHAASPTSHRPRSACFCECDSIDLTQEPYWRWSATSVAAEGNDEARMNSEHYRKRLQELEQALVDRIEREKQQGRSQFIDIPADISDVSVAEESAAEEFAAAAVNTRTLGQVREALQRMDGGTFGRCIVDDGPIEAARLEAMPWTPYCLKHQQALEDSAPEAGRL